MNTPNRLPADARVKQILDEALRQAEASGYANLTRDQVAHGANCAPGLVSHYFGTMDALRTAVLRAAVQREVLRVVAQGVIAKHFAVRHISRDLKTRALAACAPKA